MVLFSFLCFLCVQSFFSVCSFLRNWFQSLGWGPRLESRLGVSFSEKSRMFWHPQNRKNYVPFAGTPYGTASGTSSGTAPGTLIRDSSWDPHPGQLLGPPSGTAPAAEALLTPGLPTVPS